MRSRPWAQALPNVIGFFLPSIPPIAPQRCLLEQRHRAQSPHPLQSSPMFAAHTFALNIAPAATAGVAARATITKTTTIKG